MVSKEYTRDDRYMLLEMNRLYHRQFDLNLSTGKT